MKTTVYIDAFNLYYGALKDSPYRWLDLGAFCRVLLPDNNITKIKYYTARVTSRPHNPGQPDRQKVYLRTLRTIPNLEIIYGHFLSHPVQMVRADSKPGKPRRVQVIKTEEKGSDVNLAVDLIADGCAGKYECAVIISNDSDLGRAVKVVREQFDLPVGVVNPFDRPPARSLVQHASFKRTVRKGALKRCQFPDTIRKGKTSIYKPKGW